MASDWKPLHHLTTHPFIPPLLVKYEFGTSSYKVWITDLTSIWSEALDQRPMVQRAWDIETDIDPIESDQRQMLLQKIKASLDEVPGTKLALSRHDNSDSLQLTASSPLPKPFKTLQWPFHLALSPKMTLTTELVVPLLAEQLLFRKKVDSLLKILRDKDLVIGKLTDKMQSEGVEFEKIFPAAVAFKSSRKTISRDELGKSVKGLSAFDEAQWRMRCSDDLDTPGTRQGLLLQVFAHGRSVRLSEIGEQPADERWWERVGAGNPLAHDGLEEISQSQSQTSVENDFQRQPTPDHLAGFAASGRISSAKMTLPQRGTNPQTREKETADDGSTTETSDEDFDTKQPQPRESQHNPRMRSEESSSSASSSPEPAGKTRQNPPPRPKGVLGRIGGASKPTVSPSKHKLGQIGGTSASARSPKPASKSPEPKSRLSKQPESPPSPRGSSRERADEKREQLKRELEEKSKHGTKKKRKF